MASSPTTGDCLRNTAADPAPLATLCFYDLDRTVTRLPTWSLFLLRTVVRRQPWRLAAAPLILVAAIGNAVGWVGRGRFKEIMHGALLGRSTSQASLARWSEQFARHVVAKNIRPGALAQIAADRAAGYRLVLATAAHRFYAAPIARRLGIDDVIATDAMRHGDRVSNRLAGDNLYGSAKLAAVEAWLEAQGLARQAVSVRFYSDHASDAPCLTFADHGFAVNPTPPMHRLAARYGWPKVDWNVAGATAI